MLVGNRSHIREATQANLVRLSACPSAPGLTDEARRGEPRPVCLSEETIGFEEPEAISVPHAMRISKQGNLCSDVPASHVK